MNYKIKRNKTDIESGNLSAVTATTSFVVILVPSSRISSIIEKVYTKVEQDKIYGEKEQERNSIFYYKDSKESKYYHDECNEDQETTKLHYNRNFNFSIIGLEVGYI
jgi:hypothetical protein